MSSTELSGPEPQFKITLGPCTSTSEKTEARQGRKRRCLNNPYYLHRPVFWRLCKTPNKQTKKFKTHHINNVKVTNPQRRFIKYSDKNFGPNLLYIVVQIHQPLIFSNTKSTQPQQPVQVFHHFWGPVWVTNGIRSLPIPEERILQSSSSVVQSFSRLSCSIPLFRWGDDPLNL